MTSEDPSGSTAAILFADLCRSTELYERLGDHHAHAVIRLVMASLAGLAERFGGRLVKEIGDEIMCAFPTCESATQAALEMHHELDSGALSEYGLSISSGYHVGPVIEEGEDLFGDTVNVAARLAKLSSEGQILSSRQAIDSLPDSISLSTRPLGSVELKGKKTGVEIVEVLWQQDLGDLTYMPPPSTNPYLRERTLSLSHAGSTVEIHSSGATRPVTLGRSPDSLFIIEHSQASRKHATIEVRNGKFYILDHSTNGTFVVTEDGEQVRLDREAFQLHGGGSISLGEEFPIDEMHEIQFRVE